MESLEDQCGYDESIFISEIPEHLHCMICTLVLRDPIQILCCGHKACKLCFQRVRNHSTINNTELLCPVDREVVDLTDVREDIYLRRVVSNLVVRCFERDSGCEWQGDLRELHNHTEQCPFKPLNQDGDIELLTSTMKELTTRVEQCESSLVNNNKEIALLKDQLQDQQQMKEEMHFLKQQMKEEMQSLKQQLSLLTWKNIERKQSQQQEKEQLQQNIVNLPSKNEALEHQMTELFQKNIELEQKLQQQQQQQHEMLKQQLQHEINDLKVVSVDQQLKINELICEVEKLKKGIIPCGNVGSTILSTTQASESACQPRAESVAGEQLVVVMKRRITVDIHNGDPKDVTISNDTCSVQFTGLDATVSARGAVVPPASKVWYEVKCTDGDMYRWILVGWSASGLSTAKSCIVVGVDVHSYAFNPFDGYKFHKGSYSKWGKKLTGDTGVLGVALDLLKGEILFSVDGQWTQPMGVAFEGVPTDIKLFPAFSGNNISAQYNFGDRDFTFGPPDPMFVKLLDVVQ